MSNTLRRGRHVVYNIHIHLVFVTKYRGKVFNKEILNELNLILSQVCQDFDAELVEFNGEQDHVHLLVNYPPKVSISSLVNSLKGVSSRMIRKTITHQLIGNFGAMRFGLQAILHQAVAVLQLILLENTSSNSKKYITNNTFHPRPRRTWFYGAFR